MWKRTMGHLLWTFRARNFKSFLKGKSEKLIQTALNLDTKIKNRTCNQWNTWKLKRLHVNRNQWEFPWSCSGIVCFSGKAGEQEVIRLDPVTGATHQSAEHPHTPPCSSHSLTPPITSTHTPPCSLVRKCTHTPTPFPTLYPSHSFAPPQAHPKTHPELPPP